MRGGRNSLDTEETGQSELQQRRRFTEDFVERGCVGAVTLKL